MRPTYLGQCGFLIETAGVRIVTDPFLSDALRGWKRVYPASCTLKELKPDLVIISHSPKNSVSFGRSIMQLSSRKQPALPMWARYAYEVTIKSSWTLPPP